MATPLGGSARSGVRMMVRNGEGSTILKGTVVTWATTTPTFVFMDSGETVDFGTGDPKPQIPVPVVRDGLSDGTVPGVKMNLGVAETDILDGQDGEIVCHGLVQVMGGATIAAGIVITADASNNGTAIDAATASHKNPFGITGEAMASGVLSWCFVNFLNASGAAGAGFQGVGY